MILKNNLSIFDIHIHVGIYENRWDFSAFYIKELCRHLPISHFICAPVSWQQSLENYTIRTFEDLPSDLSEKSLFWLLISPVRKKSIDLLQHENIPKGYIGVKLHPYADHYDISAELLDPVFSSCEKWNVPLAIHTGNDGTDPLSICSAMPEDYSQPVILFHSRPINEAIRAAKAHKSIYLESSFCEPEELNWAFNEIDKKRILFGSDYPLNLIYYPGLNIIDLYRQNVNDLLDITEQSDCSEDFFFRNAKRIFKL